VGVPWCSRMWVVSNEAKLGRGTGVARWEVEDIVYILNKDIAKK